MLELLRSIRIFVVDDEPVIATTMAMILQRHGFNATAFFRPLEALKAAMLEPPYLVVSDIQMPLLSGMQLAALLRKYCPLCKILLFSGEVPEDNLFQRRGEAGHWFEFLSKPIHPADFVKKIMEMTGDIGTPPLFPVATAV